MGSKQIFLTTKQFLSKNLVKHTAAILSGNIIAQCIALAVYPFLTRLYSPEDFGVLNVFLSIGGIWIMIATGGYQESIMLPHSSRRAASCFQVGMILVLLSTLLCVLTLPLSPWIAESLHCSEFSYLYLFMPLYVLGAASWNLLSYWYSRNQAFKRISVYQVSLGSTNAIAKIGFSFLPFQGGLVFSSMLAPFVGIGMSLLGQVKSIWHQLSHFSWVSVLAVAKYYKKFPIYSLPRSLMIYCGANLPFLILPAYFGMSEIGWLGMGITLAFTPLNMIISAFYKVLFQRVSEMIQQKISIASFLTKIMGRSCLLLLPIFVLLYLVLPDLTGWMLGDNWEQTGHYIRCMLPWLFLMMFSATLDFIPSLFLAQRSMFFIEIISLLLQIGMLFVGVYLHSFMITIGGYFALAALNCLVSLLWIVHLIRQYERELV